jgi:glutamate-1-semialdehyde 2,1-aminomutase
VAELQREAPDTAFAVARPLSDALYRRAERLSPAGVHHNLRWMEPFPLYIARAQGARKWDVDGREYVDYAVGQGSQLLGYNHPRVVRAIRERVEFGAPGASHELELEWAELVDRLIPSAERTRFLASGTEANLLAFRLARAFTGRPRILRFDGHYHGWHDYGMIGYRPPFAAAASAGVPDEVAATMVSVDARTTGEELDAVLAGGDIAAVILEPTGASWGTVPLPAELPTLLRESTRRHGTLLIYDEVITGFRVSPGGAQLVQGVTPDLTSLGKILTGGLHGGAVCGRADVMALLEPARRGTGSYVLHHGTFNGHPLPAAAGVATLELAASGEPQALADAHADALRAGLGQVVAELGIAGFVYGDSSMFHLHLGTDDPDSVSTEDLLSIPPATIAALTTELRIRGVDLFSYNGGMASAAHGDAELGHALEAFRGALHSLRDRGLVPVA